MPKKLTCDHCGKKDCANCVEMDGRNFCCAKCLEKCKAREKAGNKKPVNVCRFC